MASRDLPEAETRAHRRLAASSIEWQVKAAKRQTDSTAVAMPEASAWKAKTDELETPRVVGKKEAQCRDRTDDAKIPKLDQTIEVLWTTTVPTALEWRVCGGNRYYRNIHYLPARIEQELYHNLVRLSKQYVRLSNRQDSDLDSCEDV
jgi:hypothetical protein